MTTSTGYGTVDPTLEVHCGTAAEACASLCSRAWPRALGFTAAVVGAVLLLTQLPSAAPAAPAALSHLPPHGVPTTTTRTTAATEPVPHPLTPVARRAILQGLVGGLVATAQPMAAMARKAPLARPELLPPGPPQDVIDTQGLLTPSQLKEVHQIIEDCLRMYGVKVRVVTARYPETPGGVPPWAAPSWASLRPGPWPASLRGSTGGRGRCEGSYDLGPCV